MASFTFKDQAFLASIHSMFGPGSYPGLDGWLKADTFPLLVDGNTVGQVGNHWLDQSGNGHDGQNHSGLNRPSYETNEVGTKPVIRFPPGGNCFLNIVSPIFLPADFTFMVVMRQNGVLQDTLVLGHDVLNHQLRRSRGTVNIISHFDGGVENLSSALAGGVGALQCFTWRKSANTISFRENKTARGSVADGVHTMSLNTIVNNLFLGTGDADIAEMVWYSQHRSDAEVDNLYDNYLKPRWVTLP